MKEKPLASVVIPTWNRKDEVLRTIQDTLDECPDDGSVEVIIVDNGSSDGTGEAVDAIRDSRLRLIRLPHNMGMVAYNIGAANAHGDIVVFGDSDASWMPGALNKIVEAFRKDPDLGIVACNILDVPTGRFIDWNWPLRHGNNVSGWEAPTFLSGAAAVRKKVLEDVGYFPPDFFAYMHEIDLATRAIVAGWDVRFFPEIVASHRRSPLSRSSKRVLYYSIRNMFWYYWKYYPPLLALGAGIQRLVVDLIESIGRGCPYIWFQAVIAGVIGLPRMWSQRTTVPRRLLPRVRGYMTEWEITKHRLRQGLRSMIERLRLRTRVRESTRC